MSKLDEIRSELFNNLKQPKGATDDKDAFTKVSIKLSTLVQEGKKVATEQNILSSLQFEFMRMRHSNIKDATPKTFQWIYRHSEFLNWLHSQSGTYWISGKAGSGKSTLMKFLCDHAKTKKALQTWAGPENLVIANYFFWSAGNRMQKSQEGLLQSLLYQVLRQCPVLIPTVCPSRTGTNDVYGSPPDPWTRQELAEAFSQLGRQTFSTTKFCFFVDGLDEYEGEKTELIHILEDLATSPSIKICLSSRPWNVFVNAFGQSNDRKLLVQDFTKDDIKHHMELRLEMNPRYIELKNKDRSYEDLIREISDKAQGVFLWVYLVVGSLLRGLEEKDEIADLQRRLDLLPKDLEDYFQHIFDAIEDAYQEETAQIFQITVQAVQPLSVMAFSFLDEEKKDPDYALKADVRRLSAAEIGSTYDRMRTRLNARCKDLLEVNDYDDEDTFFKYRVDFLHRTVRDFLKTNDMQVMLEFRSAATFDARVSLCKIFLAQIKTFPFEAGIGDRLNSLFALVDELMYYAGEVEVYKKEAEVTLLDELDRIISTHASDMTMHWTNARDPSDGLFEEYGYKTFLASAIQGRLRLYVTQKLNSQPRLLQEKRGRPLLDYALRPTVVTPIQLPYQESNIDSAMVRFLLDKGANPNQPMNIYERRTVWDLFLLSCHQKSEKYYDPRRNQVYQVAEMLIRSGANPNLRCEVGMTSSTKARYKDPGETAEFWTVSEIFKKALPHHEYTQLEVLLEEKRRSWLSRLRGFVGWE
jgi:hypothetical protein